MNPPVQLVQGRPPSRGPEASGEGAGLSDTLPRVRIRAVSNTSVCVTISGVSEDKL